MKVFEILREDSLNGEPTEGDIVKRLRGFDWMYEFYDNERKAQFWSRELELIENMVYRMWKKDPERAVKLWNENIPTAPEDKTTPPSFLFRLEAQDTNQE